MKKIFFIALSFASTCLVNSSAMAKELTYMCSNNSWDYIVRVKPNSFSAELIRADKSYPMQCVNPGSPTVWLRCQGAENRTFFFYAGGQSGLYVGSVQNTAVSCYQASLMIEKDGVAVDLD